MTGTDVALIISALGTATTAVIGALVLLLRKDVKATAEVAATTHEIVNSQRTEMVARIDQLEQLIVGGGAIVPPPRAVPLP